MGKISITIQNRTYRLTCGDGDEPRLLELADYVRARAEGLVAEHGRISDDHLMLMSAILIADELWDERAGRKAPASQAASAAAVSGKGTQSGGKDSDGSAAA